MEALIIIAVVYLFASAYTMGYATAGAMRRWKDGYRQRRDERAKGRPGGAGWGSKLAAGTAATFIGTPLILKHFGQEWRTGWPKSVEKMRTKWDKKYQPPASTPAPAPPEASKANPAPTAPGVPDEKPTQAVQPTPEASPAAVKPEQPTPRLSIVRNNPVETKTPTKGNPDMAISTVTGGDVHSLEQIRAEAEAIKAESVAELEDASADASRASEDLRRVEVFAASLEKLSFGASMVTPARALTESSTGRKDAAEKRRAAAEARMAQADAILAEVSKHETVRDAASATDGIADRSVYA